MAANLEELRNAVSRVGDAARKAREREDARRAEAQRREAGLLERIINLEAEVETLKAENAALKAEIPSPGLIAQLAQSLNETASGLEQW